MRRYIRNIVWLIGLLFGVFLFPQQAISQSTKVVKGEVSSSEGEKLVFANVLLYGGADNQLIAFAVTDETGRYQLEADVPVDSYRLITSSLGYVSDTLLIEWQQLFPVITQHIQLRPANFELEEVTIKDYKIPYKIDGDTTEFQADFYARGDEKVVEDLVRNMPGVEIKDNGSIFYKEKRVERVLIEEDDLMGQRYVLGTRSMNVEYVDKIQFIDHYQENHLLHNIKESEELVMNIKVKKDRKKFVFGNAEVGVGIPNRYTAEANLYSLYGDHKGMLVGRANNLGDSNLSLHSLLEQGSLVNRPYEYQRPARYWTHLEPFVPFELNPIDYQDHRMEFGANNLILNPSDNLKIKSYALIYGEGIGLETGSFFRDLVLGDDFSIAENTQFHSDSWGGEWKLEATLQLNDKSNLKYQGVLTQLNENERSEVITIQDSTIFELPQFARKKDRQDKHAINWVYKLRERMALVTDLTYFRDTRNQAFSFPLVAGNNLFEEVAGDSLHQQTRHRTEDVDFHIGLFGTRGKGKFSASFVARWESDQLNNQLSSREGEIEPPSEQPNLFNDWFFSRQRIGITGGWQQESKSLEWKVDGEIGRYKPLQADGLENTDQEQTYLNLSLDGSKKLGRLFSLGLGYNYEQNFLDFDDLIPITLFTSYRNLSTGTGAWSRMPGQNLFGRLSFNNKRALLQSYLFLNWNRQRQAVGSRYGYIGLYAVNQHLLLGQGDHLTASIGLDKFFADWSTNFGLNFNYTFSNNPFLNASEEEIYSSNHLFRSEVSFTSAFDGALNFKLTGEGQWSFFQTTETTKGGFNANQRYFINYNLLWKPVSKLNFKGRLRQVITDNVNAPVQVFYFTNIQAQYDYRPWLQFVVEINNLVNTGSYNMEQLGGTGYQLSRVELNPRFIVFKLATRI